MAYDRAITVFSPDGRLFQVEYAKEAVKKGSTALGMKFQDGALLIAERRSRSKLSEQPIMEKIQLVDDSVAVVTSGLIADARVLIDFSRISVQQEKITYGALVNMDNLAKRVADQMQQYTQYGGVRPFGVSLVFAGIDRIGPRLIDCDAAGTINEYKATAIGQGKEKVIEFLEKEYEEGLDEKEAIMLGLRALKSSIDGDFNIPEVATIERKKKFYIYGRDEIEKLMSKL